MGKKLLSITVKGKTSKWSFDFMGDTKYIEEWREDGLEICEIENIIPEAIVSLGLTRPWCFLQDVFYFKNPFAK